LRPLPGGAFLLIAEDYAQAALASGRIDAARALLRALFERSPAIELVAALERLDAPESPERAARLLQYLERAPTLAGAARLLALPPASWGPQGAEALRQAITRAAQPFNRYRCAACGFEAQNYFWQCPGCLSWDSYPAQRIDAL
jgi:lipopolysaccharide biosynthesis regulator YciM